jgi:hypothetical protein
LLEGRCEELEKSGSGGSEGVKWQWKIGRDFYFVIAVLK